MKTVAAAQAPSNQLAAKKSLLSRQQKSANDGSTGKGRMFETTERNRFDSVRMSTGGTEHSPSSDVRCRSDSASSPHPSVEPRFTHDFSKVSVRSDPTGHPLTQERSLAQQEGEELPSTTEIPKDKDEQPKSSTEIKTNEALISVHTPPLGFPFQALGIIPIRTVIEPGRVPRTGRTSSMTQRLDRPRMQTVAPGGSPTTGNTSNDCLPSTASAVLTWDVVDAPPDNWAVSVRSLTLAGQVNVRDWPSNPNSETVPNTANPVDGGNINNTTGSPNHWQAAIDDMANYHTAGGGAGPNWHSTAASSAHEWAHWNTDYVADSVASAAGGNWPRANADLDALREPKTSSATEADARTALQARVNARLATWRSATISRWNAIPDSPGVAGSTGYDAGAAVLNFLINSVRTYASSKGWTGTPAGPRNGPGRSPNPPP